MILYCPHIGYFTYGHKSGPQVARILRQVDERSSSRNEFHQTWGHFLAHPCTDDTASWISLASDATLKPHGVEGAAVHVEVAREPRTARRPRFGRRDQEQHSSDGGEDASPPVHDVSLPTLTCFQLWGIQHLSSVIIIIISSSIVGRGKKI